MQVISVSQGLLMVLRTQLHGAAGSAEKCYAVHPQAKKEPTMPEDQIGKRPPPGPVIVSQPVDQDERLAPPNFEPGHVDVVTARAHVRSAPCDSTCPGPTAEARQHDGSSPATSIEPAPAR